VQRLWVTNRSDLVKYALMIVIGVALLVVGVWNGPDWFRIGAGLCLLAGGGGNLARIASPPASPPEEP
jgi:hypothetical protein